MSRIAIEEITLYSEWARRMQDRYSNVVYTDCSIAVTVDMGGGMKLSGDAQPEPDEWNELHALIQRISDRIERDIHGSLPNAEHVTGHQS
jgi:hypothetical protein